MKYAVLNLNSFVLKSEVKAGYCGRDYDWFVKVLIKNDECITLGRYTTEEEARQALIALNEQMEDS